ncbi:hypothetical protein SESBI_40006 [Sesbania bispinosa]|nr:hypothetical protein SESBI_40006 [Sesbania bispinosa]
MVARARPTEAQVREGGCERFSRGGEAVVIDPPHRGSTVRAVLLGLYDGYAEIVEVVDGGVVSAERDGSNDSH